MAIDEATADRVRKAIQGLELHPGEVHGEIKMFGGLCFTLNGKMVAGIETSRLLVRGDEEALSEAISMGTAQPMDFTGRPMRNFAFVPLGSIEGDEALEKWLEASLSYVRTNVLGKPVSKRPRKPKFPAKK